MEERKECERCKHLEALLKDYEKLIEILTKELERLKTPPGVLVLSDNQRLDIGAIFNLDKLRKDLIVTDSDYQEFDIIKPEFVGDVEIIGVVENGEETIQIIKNDN